MSDSMFTVSPIKTMKAASLSVGLLMLLLLLFCVQVSEALNVVVLGDSFASGTGARDEFGKENYDGPSGCSRSPTGWASQYAESLAADSFVNRACSNGPVKDITNRRAKNKFLGSCPPDNQDEEFEKEDLFCTRYLKKQIEAVDASTDLVLISVGGIDAGFVEISTACLITRNAHKCRNELVEATATLPAVEDQLDAMFSELATRLSSQARVAMVHYPHQVQDKNYWLFGFFIGINMPKEYRAFEDEQKAAFERAVATANAIPNGPTFQFVDTMSLFAGHETDPKPFVKNPDRWIWEFETSPITDALHPNPTGHRELANYLSTQLSV